MIRNCGGPLSTCYHSICLTIVFIWIYAYNENYVYTEISHVYNLKYVNLIESNTMLLKPRLTSACGNKVMHYSMFYKTSSFS